jgi:hypothetical protein
MWVERPCGVGGTKREYQGQYVQPNPAGATSEDSGRWKH